MRAQPRSLGELSQAMRETAVGGQIIALEGGGTKQAWLRSGRTEAVIELRGLAGVLRHVPVDRVVTVQAGTRLEDVQRVLGERGQRLAVDPPLGADRAATVGGIYSTDDAGPSRLCYGSLREACLEVTAVLADGTVCRSGGRLARAPGYDLGKLFCGAWGTLGAVARLTLRVLPMPASERTVRVSVSLGAALERLPALLSGRFAPTAATFQQGGLWVRFEGPPVATEDQAKALVDLFSNEETAVLEGEASTAAWALLLDERRAHTGETTLACAAPVAAVGAWVTAAHRAAEREGLDLRLVVDVGLGATLAFVRGGSVEAHARAVEVARHAAEVLGGRVRLRERLPGLDGLVDPIGALPRGMELMRAVKAALDPVGRCQPGRLMAML